MKPCFISILLALTLCSVHNVQAQGTTYLSNLGDTFTDSNPVASDSWLTAMFITGNNAGGYALNSFELGMANAVGNPNGFMVMLYTSVADVDIHPGSSLGTLNGSDNPLTAGIYTYIPTTDILLSPNTEYFIVLTAETAAINGAYEWNYTNVSSYSPSGGWIGFGVTDVSSNGGSPWIRFGGNPNYDYSEIAITATAIPEPSPSWLILLGSGVCFWKQYWRICNRFP